MQTLVDTLWYVLGIGPAIFTGWRVAGSWAWHLCETSHDTVFYNNREIGDREFHIPSGPAWIMGYLMGIGAALTWPIVAIVYLCTKTQARLSLPRIGYTPKKYREEIQAHKKELEESKPEKIFEFS